MVFTSQLAVPKRPNFLLLGAHPAIDFANTLVPPPGLNTEFLRSWEDVIDWLKETRLSGGQNLDVPESDAPHALEKVRKLRHAWTIAEFLITAEFKYLRRCANTDSCVLVFYDTTKNHRRQWCSNSMCGNRYKVAQFRQRQLLQ